MYLHSSKAKELLKQITETLDKIHETLPSDHQSRKICIRKDRILYLGSFRGRLERCLVIESVSSDDFATYCETSCFMLLFTKRRENHAYLVPNTVTLTPSTTEAARKDGRAVSRLAF
jgi:hypothetical protein